MSPGDEKWLGGMDVGLRCLSAARYCSPAGSEILKHIQQVMWMLQGELKFPDSHFALFNRDL